MLGAGEYSHQTKEWKRGQNPDTFADEVCAQLDKLRSLSGLNKAIEGIADRIEVLTRSCFTPSTLRDFNRAKLSRSEERIVRLLFLNLENMVERNSVMDALYFDSTSDAEPKVLDVMLCKIRKKFAKHDIPYGIDTLWGRGFRMYKKEN